MMMNIMMMLMMIKTEMMTATRAFAFEFASKSLAQFPNLPKRNEMNGRENEK